MPDYSFIQSEADTILFSVYAVLQDSGYSGPIVADTDTYMAAAPISQKLPGLLCIKRKQETSNIVPEEMADCNCMDVMPTQGFYDKGKLLVYDKVAKSAEARQQLSKCGNSLDIEEEAIEELFEFTCLVIYGDKVSIGPWELQSGRQIIHSPSTRCG